MGGCGVSKKNERVEKEMKKKITKQRVMKHYYSDEELKASMRISIRATLKWLEEARQFFSKATSKKTKKLKEQLALEGW